MRRPAAAVLSADLTLLPVADHYHMSTGSSFAPLPSVPGHVEHPSENADRHVDLVTETAGATTQEVGLS